MHEGKSSFLLHVFNLQKLRAAKTALAIKLMGKLGSRKVKKVSRLARRMEPWSSCWQAPWWGRVWLLLSPETSPSTTEGLIPGGGTQTAVPVDPKADIQNAFLMFNVESLLWQFCLYFLFSACRWQIIAPPSSPHTLKVSQRSQGSRAGRTQSSPVHPPQTLHKIRVHKTICRFCPPVRKLAINLVDINCHVPQVPCSLMWRANKIRVTMGLMRLLHTDKRFAFYHVSL